MRISDGSSDVCSSDLAVQPAAAERFAARLHYQHLDADAPDDYRRLKASLDGGAERITVFYLAMAPRYFGPVCRRLAEAGLNSAAARVVLEKPIGRSEERRVGKEGVCTCRYQCSRCHTKKKKIDKDRERKNK